MNRIRRLLRLPIHQLVRDYLACQAELCKTKSKLEQMEKRLEREKTAHTEQIRILREENHRLRARHALKERFRKES